MKKSWSAALVAALFVFATPAIASCFSGDCGHSATQWQDAAAGSYGRDVSAYAVTEGGLYSGGSYGLAESGSLATNSRSAKRSGVAESNGYSTQTLGRGTGRHARPTHHQSQEAWGSGYGKNVLTFIRTEGGLYSGGGSYGLAESGTIATNSHRGRPAASHTWTSSGQKLKK